MNQRAPDDDYSGPEDENHNLSDDTVFWKASIAYAHTVYYDFAFRDCFAKRLPFARCLIVGLKLGSAQIRNLASEFKSVVGTK